MRLLYLAISALFSGLTEGQQTSLHKHSPSVQTLPPLREQASLINGWVAKRKKLIPEILRHYDAEAWLVSGMAPRNSALGLY